MRLFLSALLAALISPLAAHAHSPDSCPAPEPGPMRWQLVGFTSTSHTGDSGVLALTAACQADLGAASRMCTSEEVLDTVTLPAALSGNAWVRPVYQPFVIRDYNGTYSSFLDASGRIYTSSFHSQRTISCAGWSAGDGTGLSVDGSGRFLTTNNCVDPHPIACCALVP